MFSVSGHKDLILACHITGIYDVNRRTTLEGNDYELVRDWAESIAAQNLRGIIFHNNFTEESCAKHQNEHISFVKIAYNPQFNPNVFRYLIYRDFLRAHSTAIEHVFVTDVADVVVLNNPFVHALFRNHPEAIFCGDEPKSLDDGWMHDHSEHLRSKIADYANFEQRFLDAPMLNCGIIGGHIQVMQEFIEQLAQIHEQYNHDNQTAYTGDMGAFNYLMRTQFNERIIHGEPCNTVFKAYELDRRDCWFRHK